MRKGEEMDGLDILTRSPLCCLTSLFGGKISKLGCLSPQILGSIFCCSQEVFACIWQAMRYWNISVPFYWVRTSLTSHSYPRGFACTDHLCVTLGWEERSQTFSVIAPWLPCHALSHAGPSTPAFWPLSRGVSGGLDWAVSFWEVFIIKHHWRAWNKPGRFCGLFANIQDSCARNHQHLWGGRILGTWGSWARDGHLGKSSELCGLSVGICAAWKVPLSKGRAFLHGENSRRCCVMYMQLLQPRTAWPAAWPPRKHSPFLLKFHFDCSSGDQGSVLQTEKLCKSIS